MNKVLICLKFLVSALICFSLVSAILTAGSARAAEESDQLLEKIGKLIEEATAKAVQAGESGDLDLSKEAMAQANEAAGLLLGLADAAQKGGNAELALAALSMANQTSSVLSYVLVISGEAADASLASAALDVAEQTSLMISNIATMAQETGNPPLAQAAFNAANNTRAMITQVTETARVIAQTSTDQASVEAAEKVAAKSETVLDINTQATSTALAAGATPEAAEAFEEPAAAPPAPQEPPLQDTEAASAV